MDKLKELEKKAFEFWQKANNARGAFEKDKLLAQHRDIYQQYRKHKEWLRTMGVL